MPRRFRILVVDDDKDNVRSLGKLFELEGHDVTVACSGEAAVAACLNTDFDLAFMDVMMPGRNGVESFLAIRKLRPGARVFMMAGYSVQQLLQQAMIHGAIGVLAKPIDIDKLLRSVEEVRLGGIVLVAEEGPHFGHRLKQLMDGAGLACGLLRSEEDVIEDASELAVIDLGKPLIDGVELYAHLGRAGHARSAIIVTKPGQDGGDAFEALGDAAATGILNKPFDPILLLQRPDNLAT